MSTQRFSTSKQFIWQGVLHEVKRLLPASMVSIENLQTTEMRTVSFSELAQALFSGELRFVMRGEQSSPPHTNPPAGLSDYPEHLRSLAEYRLDIIRPLLSLIPSQRRREVVLARVAEVKKSQSEGSESPKTVVSVASIYRWVKAYTHSGNDIRSLAGNVRRQGGKQKARLEETVETIVSAVIQDRYYVPEKVTADDIYLEVLLRIEEENRFRHAGEKLNAPSKVTIWRRIDALDEAGKLIAKRGKRAAKALLAQYDQMEYPTGPLERVEIDHTRIDLIVVDGTDNLPIGRPTFTYCLDTTTRYPLGFYLGFEPPSYLTVMECLCYAILPKGDVRAKYGTQHEWIACGIPSALVVDNGREFIGVDLQDACLSLGIELDQMPVRTPYFKAAVERMFETANTGLLHTLPGTTFSNPGQRGDYQSEEKACITLDDLVKMLHIFLLDVYAEGFHRGLGDIPARRWEALTRDGFFPRLPASAEELKTLLGRVTYRVIEHFGIQFYGLRYNTQNLASLRTRLKGEKAKIKYDPADLEYIFVYDPQEKVYLQVRSLDPEYTHVLSLWKHRVIRNLARKEQDKVDILGLARAKRQIQEIVKESKAGSKSKSRVRVARWETGESSLDNGTQAVLPSPAQPLLQPVASAQLPGHIVDLNELEQEGWSAGYDLPIKKP
ncbi:MAG: DDE-type integrase/transposase/recombinase [Chloroflexi bacterium]|nr:DDE-type integrase/transposase/recombinase [Chloroflexota bacterium]